MNSLKNRMRHTVTPIPYSSPLSLCVYVCLFYYYYYYVRTPVPFHHQQGRIASCTSPCRPHLEVKTEKQSSRRTTCIIASVNIRATQPLEISLLFLLLDSEKSAAQSSSIEQSCLLPRLRVLLRSLWQHILTAPHGCGRAHSRSH